MTEILLAQLTKNPAKKGLYILCLNNMKQMSDEDYNDLIMSAKEFVNYILNDSENLVVVHPLSSNSILLEKTSVCQYKNDAYQRINNIRRQSTQPESVLGHFINVWRNLGNVSDLFDIFVVILTPSCGFYPDLDFYEGFASKKMNVVTLMFGDLSSRKTIPQEFNFSSAKELYHQMCLLSEQPCPVEIYPDHNSVLIKSCKLDHGSELGLAIFKKSGDELYSTTGEIFTSKPEIRVKDLEPDTQYMLKCRIVLRNGSDRSYENPIYFSTLPGPETGRAPKDQAMRELENIRNSVISLEISEIERLMGIYSYNILLFGRIGAGKSSFASSMNRAVTGIYDPNFAFVDFGYKPCTKEMNKLDLWNCSPIKVWDTFGLDDENYDNQVLENILDGKTTDLFQPGGDFLVHEQRLGEFAHSVVLVADVQLFAEPDELENFRKKVNLIKQKKHSPILVLTKLDSLLAEEEANNSVLALKQTKYGKQITKKAQEVFNIDRNSIFFVANYVGNESQDIFKELLAFRVLERVVERAKQFINNRKKLLIVDVTTFERKIILLAREDVTVAEFREIYFDQLTRLLKTGDFSFVGMKEDETNVLLGEIIQINEEYNERLKSILIVPEVKKLNPQFSQRTITDSLNDRASKSNFLIKKKLSDEGKSLFRLHRLQQTPESNERQSHNVERFNSNGSNIPSYIEFPPEDSKINILPPMKLEAYDGKGHAKNNLTLEDLVES